MTSDAKTEPTKADEPTSFAAYVNPTIDYKLIAAVRRDVQRHDQHIRALRAQAESEAKERDAAVNTLRLHLGLGSHTTSINVIERASELAAAYEQGFREGMNIASPAQANQSVGGSLFMLSKEPPESRHTW